MRKKTTIQEALDSYTREKESRATAERLQASLSEDLKRARIDIAGGNQKVLLQSLLQDFGPSSSAVEDIHEATTTKASTVNTAFDNPRKRPRRDNSPEVQPPETPLKKQ